MGHIVSNRNEFMSLFLLECDDSRRMWGACGREGHTRITGWLPGLKSPGRIEGLLGQITIDENVQMKGYKNPKKRRRKNT